MLHSGEQDFLHPLYRLNRTKERLHFQHQLLLPMEIMFPTNMDNHQDEKRLAIT